MKRCNNTFFSLFTAAVFLVSFIGTSAGVRAEGEIFLYRGDTYALSCLSGLGEDREYDIFIENPDIVGLNETGKEIMAIASGISEVTVRITNPDAAYSYIFAVEEYEMPVQEDYDDYVENVSENEWYDTDREDIIQDDNEAGQSSYGGETNLSDKRGDEENENLPDAWEHEEEDGAFSDEGEHEEEDEIFSTAGEHNADEEGNVTQEFESERDVMENPEQSHDGTEEKAFYKNGSDIDSPVIFKHGSSLYDFAVPSDHTLWICAKSRGRVNILYVGTDGLPVPYRIRDNMIYLNSDDLPRGFSTVQVMAASESGLIYSMSDYDICVL